MKKLMILFWLEILFFVIVLISMFTEVLQGKIFLVPMFLFGLIGVLLLFFSWKEKNKLRRWLVLIGASAAGFLVFGLLHNLSYALTELNSIGWLDIVLEVLHVAFFLISVIVCPVGFIVGLVGSIWMMRK